jgi:hypothetical protein
MAIEIDESWLVAQGVNISGVDWEDLADYASDELQLRVGNKIASKLSDKQIADFEKLEGGDDAQLDWLEKALPDYQKIVDAEGKKLEKELKNSSDKLALLRSWAEEE